ncbi:MAG: glycosyltransferase [Pseudomonadota bacterium]
MLPNLAAGGAEACMLRTANALLHRGYEVDLVLGDQNGPLVKSVPAEARVVELPPAPTWLARCYALAADPAGLSAMLRPLLLTWRPHQRFAHLPPLVRYLKSERPDVLFSALPIPNLLAVWARRLAGASTRVLVSERNTLSAQLDRSARRHEQLPRLLGRTYRMADHIIAVSKGVADDLARESGLPRERISTVYNPVVTPELASLADQPVAHRWLRPSAPPVVLGVGSLSERKDFPSLIRAFARVRAQRDCRLIILGQGDSPTKTEKESRHLKKLAASLGVDTDVDLPGFVTNPFAYMARASVFVLSSVHEGLPGALIQALACGCPVVSTDCPSGPSEILEDGRYGPLVTVGDEVAMAGAIEATLDAPLAAEQLRARGEEFRVDRAVDRYVDLMFDRS